MIREKGESYFEFYTQTVIGTGSFIFLNAFFAASEIAVVSLNSAKLRKMEEEGDKKAGRLLKLVEEPNAFLSTIQVGITLAGFLGSAFAADSFLSFAPLSETTAISDAAKKAFSRIKPPAPIIVWV